MSDAEDQQPKRPKWRWKTVILATLTIVVVAASSGK